MKKTILAAIAIVLGIAFNASAQTATPSINERQQHQQARIAQGVSSGELTRRETAQSVHDQRRINRAECRAKADGKVSRSERAHIQHEQNRASRQFHRNKHDDQQRSGA